jgi:cytochrome c oxidase subunit 3
MTDGRHHDFYLAPPSPWPIFGAIAAFVSAFGAIVWMRSPEVVLGLRGPWVFAIGAPLLLLTVVMWWRDVIGEAQHVHADPPAVQRNLRYGMILFIASEVMFFVAWFWAYFFAALYPGDVQHDGGILTGVTGRDQVTGGHWPPMPAADGSFVSTFDPWHIPLLNTVILLTSGATVTYAHNALLKGNRRGVIGGLTVTILLGLTFTAFQAFEYAHAHFTFGGHIYGATFFMATGFHGFHVIAGTLFLTAILGRTLAGHFPPHHHAAFDAAAWYWHFVDTVWLFLFFSIYVWGAG